MNAQTKAEFEKLLGLKGNNTCIDCNAYNPQWASVSNGVFMCIKCAGMHRSLGVHITFVRSVTMDSWSPLQLQRMKEGGNDKCRKFWKEQKFPKNASGRELWDNEAMEKYRQRLLASAKRENPPPIPFIGYKPKKYAAQNTRDPVDNLGSLSSSTLVQDQHKHNQPHSKSSSNLKMTGMGGGGYDQRPKSSMQGFGNYNPDDAEDDPFGDVFGGISSWASSAAKMSQEAASTLAAKSKEVASNVGERAKVTTASLRQKLEDEQLKEQVAQSATQTWMSVSSTVGSWWSSASQQVTQMYEETVGTTTGGPPNEQDDLTLYNPASGLHPSSGKYASQHLDSDSYFGRSSPQKPQQQPGAPANGGVAPRKKVKYAAFGSEDLMSGGQPPMASNANTKDSDDDTMDILNVEPTQKRKNNNHTSPPKRQLSPKQDSFDSDWGFDSSPKQSYKRPTKIPDPTEEETHDSESPQLEGMPEESNPISAQQSADDLLGNLDLDDMDLGDNLQSSSKAEASSSKPAAPKDNQNKAGSGATSTDDDDWGWDA